MRRSKNTALIKLEFENGSSKKKEKVEVGNVSRDLKVKKRKKGRRLNH